MAGQFHRDYSFITAIDPVHTLVKIKEGKRHNAIDILIWALGILA